MSRATEYVHTVPQSRYRRGRMWLFVILAIPITGLLIWHPRFNQIKQPQRAAVAASPHEPFRVLGPPIVKARWPADMPTVYDGQFDRAVMEPGFAYSWRLPPRMWPFDACIKGCRARIKKIDYDAKGNKVSSGFLAGNDLEGCYIGSIPPLRGGSLIGPSELLTDYVIYPLSGDEEIAISIRFLDDLKQPTCTRRPLEPSEYASAAPTRTAQAGRIGAHLTYHFSL